MTAIAGCWRFDDRASADADCGRMLRALALYGPEASAIWSDDDIALGRCLSHNLPEDRFDRQPLHGGGGRYTLVADLRLDNRDELAKSLEIPFRELSHHSDASVLLAAIERWDIACTDHLIGDYAFALWDRHERRLVLARDALGQRPLYYHRDGHIFAFASMPKGLHTLAAVPRELDERSLAESLFYLPSSGTRTIFRGIERVHSGHIAIVTENSVEIRRHWNPRPARLALQGTKEYCEALRSILDQAVKCRLRGATDVGAELSGGLDSSAVAATAARLLAPSGGRVVAFTAAPRENYTGPAPPNRIVDEGPYAAATAAMYENIDHVLIRGGGRKALLDLLDQNVFLCEFPVGGANTSWGNEIFERAKERRLRVLLHGSAGNLGLSYAGMELLGELFHSGHWLRLWREMSALVGRGRLRWRGALVQACAPWCPSPLWVWLNRLVKGHNVDPAFRFAINPGRISEYDLFACAKKSHFDPYFRPWKDGRAMRLSALQHYDLGDFAKGALGGWGIDYRDPTSDVRLLEFCLSVPTEQFLNSGIDRALARRALSDRLPRLVLEETRWGTQAADWHEAMTGERERICAEIERLTYCSLAARLLDLPRLQRLVEDWPEDGWDRSDITTSYKLVLHKAITTGHFIRRVTGSNS